jgi:hypothetical protein
MKTGLTIFGWVAVLSGLTWAAQGAGYFPYPRESFMINESRWVAIGLATAFFGLVALIASRRFNQDG